MSVFKNKIEVEPSFEQIHTMLFSGFGIVF